MSNEADTCRKYVVSKFIHSGWDNEKRKENDHAWKVRAVKLLSNNCNLDRKNPHAREDISHLPPEKIVESILQKEQRIAEIMGEIKALLEKSP